MNAIARSSRTCLAGAILALSLCSFEPVHAGGRTFSAVFSVTGTIVAYSEKSNGVDHELQIRLDSIEPADANGHDPVFASLIRDAKRGRPVKARLDTDFVREEHNDGRHYLDGTEFDPGEVHRPRAISVIRLLRKHQTMFSMAPVKIKGTLVAFSAPVPNDRHDGHPVITRIVELDGPKGHYPSMVTDQPVLSETLDLEAEIVDTEARSHFSTDEGEGSTEWLLPVMRIVRWSPAQSEVLEKGLKSSRPIVADFAGVYGTYGPVSDLLSAHRRPLGLGVSGPLTCKVRAKVVLDMGSGSIHQVEVVSWREIRGPKGVIKE